MESIIERRTPKIYIADTQEENRLIEYFKASDNFEFVGTSADGNIVVDEVKKLQPDILVMEVILQNLDGFAVLGQLRDMRDKCPKVFFVSNLSHSGFVTKAVQAGASYFMVKPVSPENLESRIEEVLGNSAQKQGNRQLDERISNIFISIGIPAHIKGYQFLREAVKLAVEEPEIIGQ